MNRRNLFFATIVACCAALTACGDDPAGSVSPDVVLDMGGTTTEDTGAPEDTGGDGEEDTGVDMGEEPPIDMGQTNEACTSAADCTPPEICIFDLATGDAFCGDPTGNGENGDTCTMNSDCQSGLCVGGLCADPCGGEADCPGGYTCQPIDVQLIDGSFAEVNACVPEIPVCASNDDCPDPDVCVVDLTGMQIALECGNAVGGGGIGDACAADTDCQSNLCVDGLCSAPCETSNDCSDDGSFVCEPETLTTGGGEEDLTVCKPRPPSQCLSDAGCGGGERCVASKTATDVEFACGAPNAGGAEVGAVCVDDADCAQNLCIDGTCSGPCEGAGDCSNATDYTCRVETIDLGGGNTDTAQICVAPRACTDDGGCRTAMGEVCYVRETNMDVDAICRRPNVGGGTAGQVCDVDRDCSNNYCLETRFRDVCTPPCADDGDCTVPGYECEQVTIQLAGGGTEDLGLCVPEPLQACTGEADCPTGFNCAVISNDAGDALEAACVPNTGGDATGVACNDDTDCASLVCLAGYCASPCVDDTACGQGQLCLTNDVTKDAITQAFDVCETLADQQCASSDDCSDGVRVCSDVRDVGGVDTAYCEFPRTGGAQLGTQCTAFSDCRENICLSGLSNECSVVCDEDQDCGSLQGCTTFGDLNYCNSLCSDNTDCAANGNVCTINSDVIANDVDQICTEPIGVADLGALCTTGGDCLTGLCLRTLNYNATTCTDDSECNAAMNETCECPIDQPGCTTGKSCATIERRCTALCDDGGDCSGGVTGNELTSCNSDIFVQRPDRTPKQISACARP